MHRKIWEYCFVCQALDERDMLREGRRGLGFAVGREPLPAMFANLGARIVATDLAAEEADKRGWVDSNQHAASLDMLNTRGICPDAVFRDRVTFEIADMRDISAGLRDFDFLWSSCSLEHLGSLELGRKFIFDALDCLKPGGVAVHTTEFNVSSNTETLTSGQTSLFRQWDIETCAEALRAAGHAIDLDFRLGNSALDLHIDMPPYPQLVHLRLDVGGFAVTSFGLIIRKAGGPAA
jgi:hypothetical protein